MGRGSLLISAAATLISAAAAFCVVSSPALSAPAATGLRGTVMLSPTQPVCVEGEPCSKPAVGITLVFSRNGRVLGRTTTGAVGGYRIVLARGSYTVSFAPRRPTMTLMPISVRVVTGRVRRVDFEIDTGLR
jgi:hypothetical protein